ncbi:acyltransferase [Flavobacterium sp.]|uniref:acyltransferase n=1 Tax=Flavobacterium sp. TaxID=239 RepID=UPI00374CEF34
MKKYIKLIKYLFTENYKTIWFNFKYLPFEQAIHFPIILSRNVYLKKMEGTIILNCPIKYNLVNFGFGEIGIFDEKRSRSIWQVSGKVVFNGKALFGHGTKISVDIKGILNVGSNFKVTAETAIICHNKIEFGENCLLSWDILIMDTDSHSVIDSNGNKNTMLKPIYIGNHVWIGCRTTILKGCVIPDDCVIGANSVLNSKYEISNAIYAGSPAKLMKQNINWA